MMHQHKFSGADVELTMDNARKNAVFRRNQKKSHAGWVDVGVDGNNAERQQSMVVRHESENVTQPDFDKALGDQIKTKQTPQHGDLTHDFDEEKEMPEHVKNWYL